MAINDILEQPCVYVCLYSAHVHNVFAPSQRLLGFVDAFVGTNERVCGGVQAVEWEMASCHRL